MCILLPYSLELQRKQIWHHWLNNGSSIVDKGCVYFVPPVQTALQRSRDYTETKSNESECMNNNVIYEVV